MKIERTKEGFNVDTGGLWEEPGFQIAQNAEISLTYGSSACPHCGPKHTRVHTRTDGSTYNEEYCFVPLAVVAVNEGGHNSTGVCLNCILEASAKINDILAKGK